MLIGLVSDSHGSLDRLDQMLFNLKTADVTHLLHAGDCVVYGTDEVFNKYPGIQISIALGNCDVNEEAIQALEKLPNVDIKNLINIELDGKKFAMSHFEDRAKQNFPEADIYCSGHTHRPKIEKIGKKIFLNPGSLMDDGHYFLIETTTLKITPKRFNEKI